MPYGLPEGLDTPENNAKMERCVSDLMDQGRVKSQAIAICKASIMKKAKK